MKDTNNLQADVTANYGSTALTIMSWLFGVLAFATGVVNTFWGNDTGFGVFIILLSFVYFLPVQAIFQKLTGFFLPRMGLIKILLGLFIIWAALGVGELFDKLDLVVQDVQSL